MTIETGALEQSYADVEASFAVSAATGGAALGATDAIRHLELSITSKKNREDSPEKRGTPDVQQKLPRRQTTNWNLSSIMWEPSGTLGTISNVGKFIKAAFGSNTVLSLATTVDSLPTTTSATLTSVVGIAVGDIAAFEVASGARFEVTRILSIVGSAVTFDALSVAPDDPGAVLVGITYKLASQITETLSIYKYYNAGGFSQASFGSVVDQLEATFDGTREVILSLQGPAGRYADGTMGGGAPQAKPGAHTTVGAPASGLIGNFYVDGNAFLVISAKLTVNNAIELRNKELGTQWASGIAGRANMRKVMVSVTFYMEDTRLLGLANTIVTGALRCVVGQTSGDMVAMVCPKVEFEIPDVGNEIGPKELTIEGTCLATLGNDQVTLAEL
jgi:hypothetical protein